LQLQLVKRDPLGTFGGCEDGTDVVGWQKSHGDPGEKPAGQKGHQQGQYHGGASIDEHPLEASFIEMEHTIKKALHEIVEPAVPLLPRRFEKSAAEHRGQGEGNHAGNQYGYGNGDRKLVQHSAEHPGHEENGDKNCHERDRHGEDGKAYLPGPLECRFQRFLAMLHVPDDVLQHDDCIVNDKTDRQGKSHKSNVVDGKPENVHCCKGTDNGQRESQTRNDSSGDIAKKEEDHHDHQCDGQYQGELDVSNRFTDRLGSVEKDVQIDRPGELVVKIGYLLLDRVNYLDSVGTGLPLHRKYYGPR